MKPDLDHLAEVAWRVYWGDAAGNWVMVTTLAKRYWRLAVSAVLESSQHHRAEERPQDDLTVGDQRTHGGHLWR